MYHSLSSQTSIKTDARTEQNTEASMMEVQTYHYEYNSKTQSKDLDKSRLDQCIDSIIQKEGYISCDVRKNTISTDGGNYLGQLYEINIKGETPNGEKEIPLFVKTMAPDAIGMDLISLDNVYEKELFTYAELLKEFNDIQDEADIPGKERFIGAKFYEESYAKAIILEDVTKRGFKTWYRMDCINLSMAEESIKQLARFHGLSFAIKEKRPEFFETKIKNLKQPYNFECKAWQDFVRNFTRKSLEYLNEDLRRKVQDQVIKVMEKYSYYFQDEISRSCLCHGDYRPNNVMIKEEGGKIVEAIPVDFQLLYYGCPILDFLYFMYTGTDLEFRRKHFTHLKDLYFESLKNYLKKFDVCVEEVYDRERFEKELVEKRDYGLIVSVSVLQFIFVLEGEAPDFTKESPSDCDVVLDERFRERLVGAVQEFIDLGYLKN